jgi:uncharacterized membrane protein
MKFNFSDVVGTLLGRGIQALTVVVLIAGAFKLFSPGLAKLIEAVSNWGNDVSTAVNEHEWKYTDAALYGGILVILILRYTSIFKTPKMPK